MHGRDNSGRMDERKRKKLKTFLKAREEAKAKETKDCIEALKKYGLVEPDLWHVLKFVGEDDMGHTMKDFMEMLERRTARRKSLFGEVGMEGKLHRCNNGAINSRKPTKALVKEFMTIFAFLVWNGVAGFAEAQESDLIERYNRMRQEQEPPSDALLTWMSGIRVPYSEQGVEYSVNFPDLSIYLMNMEFGIHDGESLKKSLSAMAEVNEESKLTKWVPVEHVVAVAKAVEDLKETSVPSYEVDLLHHSPGDVQRKELMVLFEKKGLTEEECEAMVSRDGLHGDCSYLAFVWFCKGCYEGTIECPIDESKMLVLKRATMFMERGMKNVLKVDRIVRFAHNKEFQELAKCCRVRR